MDDVDALRTAAAAAAAVNNGRVRCVGKLFKSGRLGRREEGKWEGGKEGGDKIEGRRRFQII